MPAILNTAKFDLNGETIILNELSALERFDYIEYVESQQAAADDTLNQLNKKNILVAAYLVAISYARTTGKSRDEQHQDIMNNWPPQLITLAHAAVSELSGFVAIQDEAEERLPESDDLVDWELEGRQEALPKKE